MKLRLITNSELTCRRRCPREHHLSYEEGFRPIEDVESLRFGQLWHHGMEMWWARIELSLILKQVSARAADPFEAAKLRVLLRGYNARWFGDGYDVVAVEREFRAPLVNPDTGSASRTFELGGKIDVLFARSFMEHKTTSEDIEKGSPYWRKLAMDPQISTYYAGARSLGIDPTACVYDVVRKPALRPTQVPLRDEAGFKIVLDAQGERVYCKTPNKGGAKPRETADTKEGWVLQTRAETPEEYEARLTEEVAANPEKYFQRGDIVRLEADEREAALDAWQNARAIREAELAQSWPRNPDACGRYGRTCGFFDVCSGAASLDDVTRFHRVDNVHPELSSEAAE